MNLDEFKTLEQLAAAIKSLDIVTAVSWKDYSATSTIVGWSSFSEKAIEYKKIGKLVFVNFRLRGTSDDTSTTFTLPYSEEHVGHPIFMCRSEDNSNLAIAFGQMLSGSTVSLWPDLAASAWTSSGTKSVYGQFWYEAV
jgi:hypothetical protein